MRHKVHHRKLGRKTAHRIATLRTMASALFEHERIQTTLMKAKELRPFAEKLITLAKRDDGKLHARRQVAAEVRDDGVVRKLFDTLGQRFSSRPGGYTRILRLGPRKGDGAEMAIVELIGSEFKVEKKVPGGAVKAAEPKEKATTAEKAPRAAKKKKDGGDEPKSGKKKAGAKAKSAKKSAAAK
ncbi:MAG: 50S ribosomal protein L17 [Byssovorax sp.]